MGFARGHFWLQPDGICQELGGLPVFQTITATCDEWLSGHSNTDPAAGAQALDGSKGKL